MDHLPAIREAAERIREHVVVTGCVELAEGLWFKREDLQSGGSFKTRGVANVLLEADERSRGRGAVCVSSGNTGRALCELAGKLGIACHVFVTDQIDPRKRRLLDDAGAHVVQVGRSFSETAEAAFDFARARNLVYCSPGQSWPFVHGVGTIGIELAAQVDVGTVYLPIGGGGLASGVGLALGLLPAEHRPRVVGVQPTASPFVYEHFHFGRVLSTTSAPSVADCLTGDLEHGAKILEVARDVLADVLLVDDQEIIEAWERLRAHGVHVEPGAAAGYAGALKDSRSRLGDERACVLLTGGVPS
ncbi:PLP-dependent lyase/thiolase [Streptosporangium sp. NPDC051023]|uniref:PLP-dependent lyase/thiolase n=1 Tax=Streptosporangium sp. NPDC051023 TaxID=3155410 RepID=UPI003450668B